MNKSYHDILDSAARLRIPDDLNLFPRVAARLNQRRTFMQTLRARPALAIILAILALLLLTGVAYALGRSLGYIPGVGFVQSSSLRILAEPVSQTRDGVTVTIEQVVVDSERTVIVYKTEGLTIVAANSKGEGGGPFGSQHLLRLPDGTILNETPNMGYGGTPEPLIGNGFTDGGWPNYAWRLVYPSVASQVNELTLVIPVLQNMPVSAAPENWEITFHLKPAPPEMTFAPITEFTPQSGPETTNTPLVGETIIPVLFNTATLNGFTFKLDNVIEVEDGFVFTGNLSWDDSVFPFGKGIFSEAVIPTLMDADGQKIPIEEVQVDAPYDEHNMVWSYRTNRKIFSGPLVFSIPSIGTAYEAPAIEFQLDLGTNPQLGQTWNFNRDFLIDGHTIRLLSVEMGVVPQDCQGVGVIFKFSTDTLGLFVNVGEVVPQEPMVCTEKTGGGPRGGPFDPSILYSGIAYKNIPSGLHHYSINASIPHVVPGPWQVTWNPPVTSEPAPTSEPGACLTLDKWHQLAGQNDALPPELGGRILVSVDAGMSPTSNFPLLQISNLDGSDRRDLVNGGWSALSPDGSRLIYGNETGFHLLDVSSGQNAPLGVDGNVPVWSPDGSRIMYSTFSNLFVMQADGAGSQKVDTGKAEIIYPIGWLPDNQTIIYSVLGEGFTFIMRNLQSGETKELFSTQTKNGFGAISPDGQWIAFGDRVFGSGLGIFVSRLDGSQHRLVASPDISLAFNVTWSPDGKWLLATTSDYRHANPDPIYKPFIINPVTCQVIGLPPVLGDVLGWSK